MNGFAVPEMRFVTTPIVPMTACCSKPDVANGWSTKVSGSFCDIEVKDYSQMYDVLDESEYA